MKRFNFVFAVKKNVRETMLKGLFLADLYFMLYILFLQLQMKFVESILSNNTTDDHCREFVNQKGLIPLMGILGLPNLPTDFPASPSCQAVASVCKSILVSALL